MAATLDDGVTLSEHGPSLDTVDEAQIEALLARMSLKV